MNLSPEHGPQSPVSDLGAVNGNVPSAAANSNWTRRHTGIASIAGLGLAGVTGLVFSTMPQVDAVANQGMETTTVSAGDGTVVSFEPFCEDPVTDNTPGGVRISIKNNDATTESYNATVTHRKEVQASQDKEIEAGDSGTIKIEDLPNGKNYTATVSGGSIDPAQEPSRTFNISCGKPAPTTSPTVTSTPTVTTSPTKSPTVHPTGTVVNPPTSTAPVPPVAPSTGHEAPYSPPVSTSQAPVPSGYGTETRAETGDN